MDDGAATLQAGAGATVITPPVGAPLMTRPSTGVHDDLYARALVLTDGAVRVALVSLDLTGLDFAFVDVLRQRIRQVGGFDLVLVNFTHTHSAPFSMPYGVVNWNWLGDEGRGWRDAMMNDVAAMVQQANTDLTAVVARPGRQAVQIGSNRRRGLEKEGADGEGIIPWVDVLRLDRRDGLVLAVLFSTAGHPVIVHHASDLISADYPGYAVQTVRQGLGADTLAMFAQGCGADIDGDPLNSGFDAAAAAGKRLGEAVIQAARNSTPIEQPRLTTASVSFEIPLADFPDEQACRGRIAEIEAGTPAGDDEAAYWAADALLCLRDRLDKLARSETPVLRFDAHAVALGDQWRLVALSHEIFSEYQRWLEGVAPCRSMMVWGYTNGCEGYIPTDHALDVGGPEVAPFGAPLWYHHRVAPRPGVEGLVKDKLKELLKRLD